MASSSDDDDNVSSSDAFSNTAAMSEPLDVFDRPQSVTHSVDSASLVSATHSRPVTSGRIPSKLSHPRLTPVSSHHNSKDSGHNHVLQQASIDDIPVLITEPRPKTSETPKVRRMIRSAAHHSAPTFSPQPQEDSEWDTDLEEEESVKIDRDTTGRTAYIRVCDRLGVVPVSYFLRHIVDQEVTMKYHGLGPVGTRAIAKVLKDNVTIEKLDLSGNWMEPSGAMYMAKLLQENDYITDLCLADNKLQSEGAYYLSKMLQTNMCLQSLDITGNDFDNIGAEYISEAIQKNKYLRNLNLSRNGFGEQCGSVLGAALGSNDVLHSIDLSWNKLRKQGALLVARGIKENVTLRVCNLSWNGFGPEGGTLIADIIAVNQSLQELDITGNRLDQTIAKLIAGALRKNDDLKILKMGNNPITTLGAIFIAKALNESDNNNLKLLDLTDIPVEYEFLRLVEEIKCKRPFNVTHGAVMRSGNTAEDIGKLQVDPFPAKQDPLVVLQEHIIVNDLRIIDILQEFDANNTYAVTQQQFAEALELLGVPFTKDQLIDISKKMDHNSDGTIYYGVFLQQLPSDDKR